MKTLKLCIAGCVLVLIAYLHCAFADDWICTEESSVRIGGAYGSIHACGVGEGNNENQARSNAFDNAKAEFDRVCSNSVDCHHSNIVVEPARTECSENDEGWKCYRMIVFHIEQTKNEQIAINTPAPPKPFNPFAVFDAQNRIDYPSNYSQ